MRLMPTCREGEARLTDLSEGALPLRERLGVRLHLLLCRACRSLDRGLGALPGLSKRLLGPTAEVPSEALVALENARKHLRSR